MNICWRVQRIAKPATEKQVTDGERDWFQIPLFLDLRSYSFFFFLPLQALSTKPRKQCSTILKIVPFGIMCSLEIHIYFGAPAISCLFTIIQHLNCLVSTLILIWTSNWIWWKGSYILHFGQKAMDTISNQHLHMCWEVYQEEEEHSQHPILLHSGLSQQVQKDHHWQIPSSIWTATEIQTYPKYTSWCIPKILTRVGSCF